MPILDGSGQANGVGSAVGAGALRYAVGGSTQGTGGPSATPTLVFGPGGVAVGLGGGSGQANLQGVFAGQAQGLGTAIGDYRVNASGVASGVGLLASAAGMIIHGGVGTTSGSGQATGAAGIIVLVTGIVGGEGDLLHDNIVESPGTASGLGTLIGSGRRILWAHGCVRGKGTLTFSYPLPMFGKGTLVGMPVVDRVPPPVNAIVGPPKCFRYLQHFQRGDLPIYISNHAGPVSPVRVVFTLFQVRPDGSRKQVGPGHRTPVKGVVGEFYATGRAGESGQPGEWVIVWEFQRTYQSAIQCKEMCFRVLDAVLAADPRDVTPRCRKFGWN